MQGEKRRRGRGRQGRGDEGRDGRKEEEMGVEGTPLYLERSQYR